MKKLRTFTSLATTVAAACSPQYNSLLRAIREYRRGLGLSGMYMRIYTEPRAKGARTKFYSIPQRFVPQMQELVNDYIAANPTVLADDGSIYTVSSKFKTAGPYSWVSMSLYFKTQG